MSGKVYKKLDSEDICVIIHAGTNTETGERIIVFQDLQKGHQTWSCSLEEFEQLYRLLENPPRLQTLTYLGDKIPINTAVHAMTSEEIRQLEQDIKETLAEIR